MATKLRLDYNIGIVVPAERAVAPNPYQPDLFRHVAATMVRLGGAQSIPSLVERNLVDDKVLQRDVLKARDVKLAPYTVRAA